MTQTRRERMRAATLEEIKATAWKQIAEQGVPALSLRAIAREMGMTAPGLYRYFESRDDLVTTLIAEAFDSFAESLEAARDALPAGDHLGRFQAVCRAYFAWARHNPAHYTLIFGAPVPGYEMGAAAQPAARRGFLVLQGLVGEAHAAGRLRPRLTRGDVEIDLESALAASPGLLAQYQALQQYGMPYTPLVTHLALLTWSQVHGLTSLYLYGYLPGFLGEQVEGFVERAVEGLAALLGFV